jgi:hypothetical protein
MTAEPIKRGLHFDLMPAGQLGVVPCTEPRESTGYSFMAVSVDAGIKMNTSKTNAGMRMANLR